MLEDDGSVKEPEESAEPESVKFLSAYKDWVSLDGIRLTWDEFKKLDVTLVDHVVINVFYLVDKDEFTQVIDNLQTALWKVKFTGKKHMATEPEVTVATGPVSVKKRTPRAIIAKPVAPVYVQPTAPEGMWHCPTCLKLWPEHEVQDEWRKAEMCSNCG